MRERWPQRASGIVTRPTPKMRYAGRSIGSCSEIVTSWPRFRRRRCCRRERDPVPRAAGGRAGSCLGAVHARGVLRELGEEAWYADLDAALDALRRRSQFNVIDLETGWKAHLVVRKDRPFSSSEFGRRERVVVAGLALWMASREDIVISKLEWAARTGSTRQLRDVTGILRADRGALDHAYVEGWVAQLGLGDVREAILLDDPRLTPR